MLLDNLPTKAGQYHGLRQICVNSTASGLVNGKLQILTQYQIDRPTP